MRNLIPNLTFAVLASCSASALAHHSAQATYQMDDKIQVEGVVTEFSFRNPHILVYLDVTDADGNVTNWMSEGAAATLMRRSGWDRDTLRPGQLIRINGSATHDGSPMVLIDKIDVLDPDDLSVAKVLERQRGSRTSPHGADRRVRTTTRYRSTRRAQPRRPRTTTLTIRRFSAIRRASSARQDSRRTHCG